MHWSFSLRQKSLDAVVIIAFRQHRHSTYNMGASSAVCKACVMMCFDSISWKVEYTVKCSRGFSPIFPSPFNTMNFIRQWLDSLYLQNSPPLFVYRIFTLPPKALMLQRNWKRMHLFRYRLHMVYTVHCTWHTLHIKRMVYIHCMTWLCAQLNWCVYFPAKEDSCDTETS